jgi:hypothetical protein
MLSSSSSSQTMKYIVKIILKAQIFSVKKNDLHVQVNYFIKIPPENPVLWAGMKGASPKCRER